MKNGKRILIVDDDEPFRQTLCNQMQLHEEFSPVEAATGTDALEKSRISCRRPDVRFWLLADLLPSRDLGPLCPRKQT